MYFEQKGPAQIFGLGRRFGIFSDFCGFLGFHLSLGRKKKGGKAGWKRGIILYVWKDICPEETIVGYQFIQVILHVWVIEASGVCIIDQGTLNRFVMMVLMNNVWNTWVDMLGHAGLPGEYSFSVVANLRVLFVFEYYPTQRLITLWLCPRPL